MATGQPNGYFGQVVLPCDDVEASVAWFVSQCGFDKAGDSLRATSVFRPEDQFPTTCTITTFGFR